MPDSTVRQVCSRLGGCCQATSQRAARPCAAVRTDDNELLTLELIHHFVEVLDKYFKKVCELDLIFNFHKARRTWELRG